MHLGSQNAAGGHAPVNGFGQGKLLDLKYSTIVETEAELVQ